MTAAWIRRRQVGPSKRNPKPRTAYQVLYRRGGRYFPIETAGTFRTDREARLRRDLVAGWLAQGLNPKDELAKLAAAPPVARSFADAGRAYKLSRRDASASTLKGMQAALDKITAVAPDLAGKDPRAWTVGDVQTLVAALLDAGLTAGTVDRYLTHVKLVLDFADADPNPARDRRVKLPSQTRGEVSPPSSRELLAILERAPRAHRLALVVLEQTAMRVGELASLTWADVDVAGNRFRLSRERTKTRNPRWVQVPEWLMQVVDATVPREDRTDTRLVFPITEAALRSGMSRACRLAGIPTYSPHDLRHRRASLWHGQGVPTRELMARGGWQRSDVAIDTYSHVLMDTTELSRGQLEELLVVPR